METVPVLIFLNLVYNFVDKGLGIVYTKSNVIDNSNEQDKNIHPLLQRAGGWCEPAADEYGMITCELPT